MELTDAEKISNDFVEAAKKVVSLFLAHNDPTPRFVRDREHALLVIPDRYIQAVFTTVMALQAGEQGLFDTKALEKRTCDGTMEGMVECVLMLGHSGYCANALGEKFVRADDEEEFNGMWVPREAAN